MTSLAPLFSPAGVAVVCASRDPKKLGDQLLYNLTDYGFAGEIYPVNPDGEAILGRPALSRIADLPEGLDLALVSLPAREAGSAIRELAGRGVRVVVVLSSGFGEAPGGIGQEEMAAIARKTGMRLVGPNCMGIYSTSSRLNATSFRELPKRPGPISVVSQSGAYGGLIVRHLASLGLGVAKFASIGNQVDVGVEDLFEYLADDPETGLIACFLESVGEGGRFVEAARRATAAKPVVVLRGGRTRAGGRAAGSHTGALAGQSLAYEAAFRRGGIVSVQETEEFLDAIQALALWRGPLPRGRSVAIVTVSSGPSVIAADAAESVGLMVPLLAEPVRAGLERILPPSAAAGNPVDLTPEVSPSAVVPAVEAVLADETIDGALAVDVGFDLPELAAGLIRAASARGKPVVACAVDAPEVTRELTGAGVPVLPTPERAVRAYRALYVAGRRKPVVIAPEAPPPLAPELQQLLDTATGVVPYREARRILEAVGIPFCREGWAASAEEAVRVAKALGFPVVIKAIREDLLHKSEHGAVKVGLNDGTAVIEACRAIMARMGRVQLVVQEQVESGVELLIGGHRDPVFGPVVGVGTGGVLAEAVRDVSLGLAPLDAKEAGEMLRSGLRATLLRGYRGVPACDDGPLVKILRAVGRLLDACPRIAELDLNPVIARGRTATAVDALLILG